jgi:hypothetical protein
MHIGARGVKCRVFGVSSPPPLLLFSFSHCRSELFVFGGPCRFLTSQDQFTALLTGGSLCPVVSLPRLTGRGLDMDGVLATVCKTLHLQGACWLSCV